MSLDLINHKLTTSTTDSKGVTTWSNPAVNVNINSTGKVFKDGKLHKGYFDHKNMQVRYYITLSDDICAAHNLVSFNSLFSRMVLGVKLGGKTICLKDNKVGYTKDNVSFVGCRLGQKLSLNIRPQTKSKAKQKTLQTTQEKATPMDTTIQDKEAKQYYTLYEAKNEHTTEDGAVFPTKELAEWHQTKVTKGKGNAQVVLDYNGGYVLAEQIYLQEVVYNKAKPYTNFIDVLNNNQGIVSVVQEEHCKFDKIEGEGFKMLGAFKMGGVYNLITSKFKAVKIQEALEQYSKSYLAFNESANHLDKLIKESV